MLEPRVHLAPPNGGAGHFNILRGHLGPEHVSGVKVVGDFVGNWRLGLPSELALVLLLDPDTGMPLGIVDGISAPGLSLDLRAEMDVLVVISNCPQINNPCNGFDPTPIRLVVTR